MAMAIVTHRSYTALRTSKIKHDMIHGDGPSTRHWAGLACFETVADHRGDCLLGS